MVLGSCICKEIGFQINRDNLEVIQCHCSKCRKITGSTADAMIVVPSETFTWTKGVESIAVYKPEKGSERPFCFKCGGPLPKRDGEVYWVPAGILDSDYKATVKAHIFVGSKLDWEEIGGNAPQYHENITQ